MLDCGTELVIAAATTPGEARSFSRMPVWMRNVSWAVCEKLPNIAAVITRPVS